MIIHSRKPEIKKVSAPVEEVEKKEEVKVEVVEEKATVVKKSKKIKEEEPILPLIEDDFSLIEEEYNS